MACICYRFVLVIAALTCCFLGLIFLLFCGWSVVNESNGAEGFSSLVCLAMYVLLVFFLFRVCCYSFIVLVRVRCVHCMRRGSLNCFLRVFLLKAVGSCAPLYVSPRVVYVSLVRRRSVRI